MTQEQFTPILNGLLARIISLEAHIAALTDILHDIGQNIPESKGTDIRLAVLQQAEVREREIMIRFEDVNPGHASEIDAFLEPPPTDEKSGQEGQS